MKLISATVKLLDGSERLKIKVAESPPWRLDLLLATEIVGNCVSIENTSKLFVSKPSALAFPAASEKTPLAMLTTPLLLLLAAGVNKTE